MILTVAIADRTRSSILAAGLVLLLALPVGAEPGAVRPDAADRIDFNRDIRPLLSNTCYECHGPDENKRQAGLRLDVRDSAVGELESGVTALVAGKRTESEAFRRISSSDPERLMPPADSTRSLSHAQIELIGRWIDQGAEYQGHWSFLAPQRLDPPAVQHEAAVRNPIDRFIIARLQREGLAPSPEADKVTLIRRVTLDLTGLPPTPAEVAAFLADETPAAYDTLVERLLDSPRYGEHMARYWLDAARYGDTHGLHLDNERSIWPYRDWVISAFNCNQPFDQFTVEQLAGDLLPGASLEQRVATGFNRCNVTTSEGGSIDEEYYVRYAVDRVETTSTVWLGLTLGCAVCHDHKFDPVTQKEFYQLFAYFNSLTEKPMDGNALSPPPVVQIPTPEFRQQQEALQQKIAAVQQRVNDELAKAKAGYVDPIKEPTATAPTAADYVWIDDELPAGAKPEHVGEQDWTFVGAPDHPVYSGAKSSLRKAKEIGQHLFTGASPGLAIGEGDTLFAYVYLDPNDPPKEIMLQFNTGTWEHRAYWGDDAIPWGEAGSPSRVPMGPLPELGKWVRLEVKAPEVNINIGAVITGWAFTQHGGTVYWDKAGAITATPQAGKTFESQKVWEAFMRALNRPPLTPPLVEAIRVEPAARSAEQQRSLDDQFHRTVLASSKDRLKPHQDELDGLNKQLEELNRQIPSSLVMEELPTPREAFVLVRGQYDKRGDKVGRGLPAVFPPLPDGAPQNRLGLAQWLTRPDHPLTARVTVNRYWQRYFGTGIVKTADDFGAQGEWPSHPELLDWLATEFIASGWNVKHVQKLIVTSATYRQSAKVTPLLLEKDKDNRLLGRGPRFRMDAEMVRDLALFNSGLLMEKLGGRSVKPYQPAGLWEAIGYPTSTTARFKKDEGESLYRRSLYTFWKRTSPPPSLTMFDAPSREACTVSRARTNTPMQALTLMNDIQYVEAARKMGERIMAEGGAAPAERLTFAFRLATSRQPTSDELAVLQTIFDRHLARYRAAPEGAKKLLTVGDAPRNETLDPAELAAYSMACSLVLNLDETLNK